MLSDRKVKIVKYQLTKETSQLLWSTQKLRLICSNAYRLPFHIFLTFITVFPLIFKFHNRTLEKFPKFERKKLQKQRLIDRLQIIMEKMKNILKPKPNPQQLLKDWQRRLRQECRNIERQIRGRYFNFFLFDLIYLDCFCK